MFPDFARDDTLNSSPRHIVFSREAGLSFSVRVSLSDFRDLGFGEFRARVGFALRLVTSALSHFVGYIVGICSQKQVCRINANWVVAPMEDAHSVIALPLRNWPLVELPGKTVSKYSFASIADVPVSVVRYGSCPQPARIGATRFVNLIPKAFFDASFLMSVPLMPIDESNGFSLNVSQSRKISFGNGRGQAASALAELRFGKLELKLGELCARISHVISSVMASDRVAGHSRAAATFFGVLRE